MTDRPPTPVEAMTSKRLMNMNPRAPQVECVRRSEQAANLALAKGRRGGGTYLGAGILLYDLCFRDDLDKLVKPGETRYAVCVATNLEQARRAKEAADLIVEGSPMLRSMLEASTSDELRFRLPGGGRSAFKAMPCSSRGIRGWAVSSILMDECAFHTSVDDGDATAERVYAALRPSTAQFGPLARVWLVSSPMGDQNWFATMWKRADEGLLDDWIALKYTSQELNPTITDEFLRQVEQEDPDTHASEYLAEFEAGGANQYNDMSRVKIDPDLGEAGPGDATSWVAGIDPATSVDSFGVALLGVSGEALKLGPVRAFAPDKMLRKRRTFERIRGAQDKTLAQVAGICGEYGARVYTDQHLSQAIVDRLGELGVHASTEAMTRETKYAAFRELRGFLYSGRLVLPNNPTLIDELQRVKVKIEAGGPKIILGRTSLGHSDQAQALALAALKQRHGGAGVGKPSGGERFADERGSYTTFGNIDRVF